MIQETEKASNVDYQLFARPASQETSYAVSYHPPHICVSRTQSFHLLNHSQNKLVAVVRCEILRPSHYRKDQACGWGIPLHELHVRLRDTIAQYRAATIRV